MLRTLTGRRIIRVLLILLLLPPVLAAVAGWLVAPAYLHPIRRELTPDLIREADASFALTHAGREPFDVRAPDGTLLRGWKVTPPNSNGSWVLLFHGVADNRVGVTGQAEVLLRSGYGVVMMDARAHGASEGSTATYGWLERQDTRAVIDRLFQDGCLSIPLHGTGNPCPPPRHIFALGESMGAGIALESAATDPRIEAVVAEASFANLREAAYDYAGLRKYPWLGKTLLSPFAWTLLYRGARLTAIPLAEVSPAKAVGSRAFPVLLICDEKDVALPCRHTQMIYDAARGPKQLWIVPNAYHTAALGFYPEEFKRRVLEFFETYRSASFPAPAHGAGRISSGAQAIRAKEITGGGRTPSPAQQLFREFARRRLAAPPEAGRKTGWRQLPQKEPVAGFFAHAKKREALPAFFRECWASWAPRSSLSEPACWPQVPSLLLVPRRLG